MELLLEIISPQRHSMPVGKAHFTFKTAGGTIGRSDKNDWTIDDPERLMSGQHASVHFENKHFLIIDNSTNGLFINQSELPLADKIHIIVNGDKFSMGQFEFQATLIATQSKAVFSSSTEKETALTHVLQEKQYESPVNSPQLFTNNLLHAVDPLGSFTANSAPGQRLEQDILSESDPVNSVLDPIPSTQSYFELPNAIPDDWLDHDFIESRHQEQAPQAQCQPVHSVGNFEDFKNDFNLNHELLQQTNQQTESDLIEADDQEMMTGESLDSASAMNLAATPVSSHKAQEHYKEAIDSLLNTLGINPDDIASEELSELTKNIALVAKDSMSGIMQTMVARAHMKNEFRLSMTTIQTQENNPLKFCINYEQLLHYLLLNPMTGYLDAEQAVKQSFLELQEHQIGVMAGMKAALLHMLDKISPDKIAQQSDRNKATSIVLGSKKSRYWDAYHNLYQNILSEDDVFSSLFSNEFCRAYDQQIEHIRQTRQST